MAANKILLLATLFMATWTVPLVYAADIDAGKNKAAMCASCHGSNGISAIDMWPNLAGQKTAYLIKQLRDFRDGSRNDAVMAGMSKALSDEDIENLAAYYNSLSP